MATNTLLDASKVPQVPGLPALDQIRPSHHNPAIPPLVERGLYHLCSICGDYHGTVTPGYWACPLLKRHYEPMRGHQDKGLFIPSCRICVLEAMDAQQWAAQQVKPKGKPASQKRSFIKRIWNKIQKAAVGLFV